MFKSEDPTNLRGGPMAPSRSSALALLELGNDATRDEITHAYHRLARDVHPDRCGSPDAAERFSRLRDAYARALQDLEPVAAPPAAEPARPRAPHPAAFFASPSHQRAPIVAGPVSVTPPRGRAR
jgi:hypothetical protein